MRLERLDLSAYGHFTGHRLDFSPPARLHVVYGPNESGKSTTLAAITDLLFGFKPSNHPYTFLHGTPVLGGLIRGGDGAVLEFVRQRSKKGAGLVTLDRRSALPDDATAPFLAGVGKDEFLRLFSLNSAMLRAGGREMLNPDSDIGRKLFAAGAGLGDLYRVEKELATALDGIGGLNGLRGRQDQRLISAGHDYKNAEEALKAATLKAGDLTRAQDAVAAAERAAQEAQSRLAAAAAETATLDRQQRIRPLLAELDRLRAAAAAFADDLPDVPAVLADQWRAALEQRSLATAGLARAQEAEQAAAAALAEAPATGPFAACADEIATLVEGLKAYRDDLLDLPKRRAERARALETTTDALRALGVVAAAEDADLLPPTDVDRAAARDLVRRREACRTALVHAEAALCDARARTAAAQRRQTDIAPPPDPPTPAGWSPPSAEIIAGFQRDDEELRGRERALAEATKRATVERDGAQARIDAARQAGEPPDAGALAKARDRRDFGVGLLAAAAAGAPDIAAMGAFAGDGDFADAVAAAVTAADRLADRRSEEAARVQAFEAALERRAVAVAALARTAEERAALAAAHRAAAEAWSAAWAPVPARDATTMRDWAAARTRRLEQAAAAAEITAQCAEFEERATAAAKEAAIRSAASDTAWAALAPRLRQPADLADAALETVLTRWDEVVRAAAERRSLDHRIKGMTADAAAYTARIDRLRTVLAAAGIALPEEAAAATAALRDGLAADRRAQTRREQLEQALTACRRQRAAAQTATAAATDALQALRAAHGLGDDADVLALCAAADERRRLQQAVADAERRLLEGGDGRLEADLRREAGAADPDADAARLTALADELAQAQADNNAARTELGEARAEWARLQQGAGAESAAVRRNEAARRAGAAADELLQLKAAQILLRRTVERYREANQDPLLARASDLFAAVAGCGGGAPDPVVRLESRVGADNRPVLHAVRRGGGAVTAEGLSEGTADQLFLALRLAAVEQRADAGRALPFIADDVFMTSDDARAEAGLRLLAELGRRVQVIVFTHHAGVVDAARRAADGAVNLIDLTAPPAL